ncbi:DNA/RNA non-specific endonuclease, partial [Glutamicibacter sp. AOP38-B1-38]|uniref:DNA/RNA non-specific endonuclease n=1 Tax=Glutamicibacter sp. AOP38-B1-38 TaxID=3457680 RepID=UPI00403462FF
MPTRSHQILASVHRTGYDPNFLGTSVALPLLDTAASQDAVLWEGSNVIPYTHFSLSLSKSRRLARWVAWNIDGAATKRLSRSGLEFGRDLRLPEEFQSGNELYQGNRLDRGHIARRADLVWGEVAEAQQANEDSFFYTNIAPQMDDFNQSSQEGIWGQLENALYEQVDVEDLKVTVFGGPVFQPGDQVYRGVGLPSEYWKLIAFKEAGVLKARAFLLTQDLDQLRVALALDEFRVYQVSVGELEQRTDLEFAESMQTADDQVAIRAAEGVRMESITDIKW